MVSREFLKGTLSIPVVSTIFRNVPQHSVGFRHVLLLSPWNILVFPGSLMLGCHVHIVWNLLEPSGNFCAFVS